MEKSHAEGDGECSLGGAVFPSMVREGLPAQNLKEGGSQQIPRGKNVPDPEKNKVHPRRREGGGLPREEQERQYGNWAGRGANVKPRQGPSRPDKNFCFHLE